MSFPNRRRKPVVLEVTNQQMRDAQRAWAERERIELRS